MDEVDAVVDPAAPPCPKCGRPGVPVLYGLPGPEASEAAGEGELVLAGCLLPEKFDHWACRGGGHRWSDPDGERQNAAVRQALRGRPRCRRCGGPSEGLCYEDDPNLDFHARDLRDGATVLLAAPPAGAARPRRRCLHCYRSWSD